MTETMNASDRWKFETMRDNLTRSLNIIEGMCPAGSLPASGSRTREAGSKPDAPLTFAEASPFADQGKGELRRLRDEIKRRADSARAMSERRKRAGLFDSSHYYLGEAAAFDSIARMLAARLRESRPQSEESEVEECQCDKPGNILGGNGYSWCSKCSKPTARGKRSGASGSANDQCPAAEQGEVGSD